jgi:hypothetical protein
MDRDRELGKAELGGLAQLRRDCFAASVLGLTVSQAQPLPEFA